MRAVPSILSTKILREQERTFVHSLGWTLREEAFIEMRPLFAHPMVTDTDLIKAWWDKRKAFEQIHAALNKEGVAIFTSENGVHYLPALHRPDGLNTWSIACLSGKTLEAVQDRFREEQVVYTAKNARELAIAIANGAHAQDRAAARFTKAAFFCARDHRPELPTILREAGIDVTEVPVYETTGTPKTIDTPFDAILFFSPSGVASFFQLNRLEPGTVCFAIGETTAEAIKDYTDTLIIVSESPNPGDLLTCVRFYYDNQQCYE